MESFAGVPILFQDLDLLVINKPAGLATLPDGYDPTLPHIKSLLEPHFGRLWVVHRLDKDTSGVLLLARTAQAHRSLNTQFEQHIVAKVYHALVIGSPAWKEKTVDLALRANSDRQHRTVVDPLRGKPAITHLRVLERFHRYTLIEAIPETGRTHQIRAHLATLELAIVGDHLYKLRPSSQGARILGQSEMEPQPDIQFDRGMGLHARLLAVQHPHTGEKLALTAAYPEAWEVALLRLRTQAASQVTHHT